MPHDYTRLCREFVWRIPARYNMAADMCRHDPAAEALLFVDDEDRVRRYSFGDIRNAGARYANALIGLGLGRGDRAAVMLAQSPETAIAHLGALMAGAVSVPLSTLFGDDALVHRLTHSGARAIVTDLEGVAKLDRVRDRLPNLHYTFVVGSDAGSPIATRFDALLEMASDRFEPVGTRADEPAILLYTSGTTGNPKGALLPHRALLGHQPGMEFLLGFFPEPADRLWSPADWAWVAGLYDVLFTAWHHGVPVVAHRARRFDPERSIDLMARHAIRNAFLPPTALKLLRQADVKHSGLKLRSAFTGGETPGAELLDWARSRLGVELREGYGQTECNVVVCNAGLFPARPGSMGKAAPGHDVRIVDDGGRELPRGEAGHVAIRRPNPVMFLEYWRDEAGTHEKFVNDFLITGDTGRQDEDGYFWYVGRSDDVIKSGGYRIGPGEIENCLMTHPAVAMAAVVGIPDPVRNQAIKAWIVLRSGVQPTDALAAELQAFVRTRLAAHEYPRAVQFTDALPMGVTGKILRRELRKLG
jgi:acetyl-CoA synthetase